jgi:hypothetical protein
MVAVLAAGLPYKLGLFLAVILGMAAAMVLEEWLEKKLHKHGAGA